MARNAEEINNLHQKILLAEKRRTEEATMKVIYLLKTVQDLNRRLMVSTRKPTRARDRITFSGGVEWCDALFSPPSDRGNGPKKHEDLR